ncbi:sulfatase-like hydrolase/transferase [Marinobacter sp. F4218]|uniref:sulfatase-like hydrolase/transferase n=1 Tax=Marinobacter sp. F4218 TaxID=2862868 RepID=UPI001C639363|nr:sulfatase-like hydrolase/transferase [Marinobacter sp. F4218]MBW7471682.1 sulfatase-like hydrolase/transferase [Marinobacter sp. F4218]
MSKLSLRKTISLAAVSLLLLVEFGMFYDFFYPFQFLWSQGQITELLLSVMVFLWSLAGVFLVFFSDRSLFRKITLPFFIFFFLSNIGSFLVSNAPIDFQQADLIASYFQWWAGAVVENIGLAVLPLFIVLVPLILFVERLPGLFKLNIPGKFYAVPVITVLLVFIALLRSDGIFDRYPSFFRVPALLVFAGQSELFSGERSGVSYSGSFESQVEKIVLIVDESIRADILGINGYSKDTTPYLSSVEGGLVNFGLAASASNCSDYSNLILRTGARKEAIPDRDQMSLKTPTIWQFTRRAGYSNVYLDAQSAETWANYQNFMNDHEASFIDDLLRLRQETAFESDGVARDTLIALLKQPGKTFIMLNKYGIHFPYFRSYPLASTLFTPVLEPGEPMNDQEKSLNSYMNGLRWSVDDWFRDLLSESGEFRKYVIVYTSDHGQNIVDDGTLATHCRPRANRFEGIVPMMVFSNVAGPLERLKVAQATGYDRTSHFQVFPTLLMFAGYNDSWVTSHYGASLSEPPGTAPEFFVGDAFGRGSVRQWRSIFPTDNDDGQ